MSLLYVCDGCDVRARSMGHPPQGWITLAVGTPPNRFTVDACPRTECREKVAAMERAPEIVPTH